MFGPSATASLAGKVQGVVVQMTSDTGCVAMVIEIDADTPCEIGRIGHAEFHVDGGRRLVLVLHLGFGQR